jgi:hypothetical protein
LLEADEFGLLPGFARFNGGVAGALLAAAAAPKPAIRNRQVSGEHDVGRILDPSRLKRFTQRDIHCPGIQSRNQGAHHE